MVDDDSEKPEGTSYNAESRMAEGKVHDVVFLEYASDVYARDQ